MTRDAAIAAVEATLDSPYLMVDRRGARANAESYLLLVLDMSRGRRVDRPGAKGPPLVDKNSGEITRLTVPDALDRAGRMALATA
jgi:hypothetical protein